MSDPPPLLEEYTTPCWGEWWWVNAIARMLINENYIIRGHNVFIKEITFNYTSEGGSIKIVPAGEMKVINNGDKTTLHVSTDPAYAHIWDDLLDKVILTATIARFARRTAIGFQFEEILDGYYAMKDRGERPKLSVLAQSAGVNYDSLRQYKVRYDKQRKIKSASNG